jgi:DNA-binding NarL/FixJ family response regulator
MKVNDRIFLTVHFDVNVKEKFENFFKQRGMSFEHALDFIMRDFLVKYQVRVLEERMDEFKLSPREKDVVQLYCTGKQVKEIAHELFISIHTVKKHLHHAYQKCKVENRVELMNTLIFRSY